jgi:diguanylate cyclase (GGDEF)-like protein
MFNVSARGTNMSIKPRKSIFNCISNMLDVLDGINNLQGQEKILHRIVNLLIKDLGCKTCAIVEMHPQTKLMEIKNFHGLSWSFCKDYRKQMSGEELSSLLWKGNPIYAKNAYDTEKIPHVLRLNDDAVSCYVARLMAKNQPMGFLYVDSDEDDYFKPEQQQIITLYSKLISMNIFLNRLWSETKVLQKTDESGAVRYDHFHAYMQEVFDRSRRLDENFCLMLLDVQGYGNIVKKYGIDCSATLMKELVTIVENNLRLYDGLCRYTADTLLIAFPGSNIENAHRAADKLLGLINSRVFTKEKLKIMVHVGLASYPENSKDLGGLLTAVRNALLEAKRTMREIFMLNENDVY